MEAGQGLLVAGEGSQAASQGGQVVQPGQSRYIRLDEGHGLGAIGIGGFGRVYIAEDTHTKNIVAVKRQALPSTVASRELSVFSKLSAFKHHNVLHMLDHFLGGCGDNRGRQSQCLYFVFEYMPKSVQSLWAGFRGFMPLNSVQRYIRQIVAGIAHIHAHNLVHGDLSMGNILVSDRDVVKIADFGGTACADAMVVGSPSGCKPLTASGGPNPTEYIRAPELFFGLCVFRPAIDLWALGVVALTMLTGSSVFKPFEEAHKDDVDDAVGDFTPNTLGRQVYFLGRISNETWPGCEELPQWKRLKEQRVSLIATLPHALHLNLANTSWLKRPVNADSVALGLVCKWLQWQPDSRLRAKDAIGEEYLCADKCQPSTTETMLVEHMSRESLVDMVQSCLRRGDPITEQTILDHEAKRRKRESDADGSLTRNSSDGRADNGDCGDGRRAGCEPNVAVCTSTPMFRIRGKQTRQATQMPEMNCCCFGNCGSKMCKDNQNKRRFDAHDDVLICQNTPSLNSGFCVWCRCECCGKGRQASHGGCGRWCSSDCAVSFHLKSGHKHYQNAHGEFELGATWSQPLKLAASFGYVTVLTPFDDRDVWNKFILQHIRIRVALGRQNVFDYGDWVVFVVVACVKWPPLVHRSITMLDILLRPGCEPTAKALYDFLVWHLKYADGADLGNTWCFGNTVLDQSFDGTIGGWSGIVPFCVHLGIIGRIGAEPESSLPDRALRLGGGGEVFVFKAERDAVDNISHFCGLIQRHYPSGCKPDQSVCARSFLQTSSAISKELLPYSEAAGRELHSRLLSIGEVAYGSDIWDDLPFSTLRTTLPGSTDTRALDSWTCVQVRYQFAMSPVDVCMWSSEWASVSQDVASCLKHVGAKRILNVVRQAGVATQWHTRAYPVPASWAYAVHRRHAGA